LNVANALKDTGWRGHLSVLALLIAAILAVFARDGAAMAVIWWTSSTFNHCMLILPIVAWLILLRRREVAVLTPQVWSPGLALIFAGAFGWMLGEAAGFGLVRHAALVFMIQASVLTLLGPAVTRALLFPLFYLIFLIPMGEELVPPLQTITAKICIGILKLSGIPSHVDGVFITTPNGYFQVAEACSGVKFLVAMIAYGALVANVCFRSWPRRLGFMTLAVVVPILANGVRAFGTIYIGWLTDTDFAGSFDHVVYGWFFFAFVMGTVMLLSWKFFDRRVGDAWLSGGAMGAAVPSVSSEVETRTSASLSTNGWKRKPVIIAALAVTILLIPVGWQAAISASGRVPVPHQIAMPAVSGWTRANADQRAPWAPRFDGADHRLLGTYTDPAGDKVELALIIYGWQEEGRKIIGYAHGAADPDGAWRWTADLPAPEGAKAERIIAPGHVARIVVSSYVLGGTATANPARIKLATLKSRLIGGDQAAVAVLVSAEERGDHPARPAIDRFLGQLGPIDHFATGLVAQARGK
jgi:exosortase A